MSKHAFASFFVAVGLLFATAALANDWNNPAGGSFQDASNWNGGVPTSTTDAVFNLSASTPYTVTFDADASSQRLMGGDDKTIFDLGGHTYTLPGIGTPGFVGSDAGQLGTAAGQSSNFTIRNGTLHVGSYLTMAAVANSSARLTIGGAGSTLSLDWHLYAGTYGSAEVNVIDGGSIVSPQEIALGRNAGSSGTLNLSGIGSVVDLGQVVAAEGSSTTGNLSVTGGALLKIRHVLLGWGDFSNSAAIVSGVSGTQRSTIKPQDLGDITVAYGGTASLAISDGALVNTDIINVGSTRGSAGTITVGGASGGFNAELNVSHWVNLANNGGGAGGNQPYTGTLVVNPGGKVSIDELLIGNGYRIGSNNIVGIGTLTINGGQTNIRLMHLRSGAVNLVGGALSTSTVDTLTSGFDFNQSGGSHITSQAGAAGGLGSITISKAGTGAQNTYNLSGGGLVANLNNSDHFNYSGGRYTGTLTNNATGVVTISGGSGVGIDGSVINKGLFRLAGADATMQNYSSIATATVALQLASAKPDRLLGFGSAGLAGSLELTQLPGFDPAPYTPIQIVAFGAVSGQFATISGLDLNDNYRLAVSYFPTQVTLTPALIGDLNLDRAVTIADFIELAEHFDQSGATWATGDLNGDGQVSIADFIDLAGHFNSTYAGEALPISAADQQLLSTFASEHGASVPEPVGLILLELGILAMAHRRRRRRPSGGVFSSAQTEDRF